MHRANDEENEKKKLAKMIQILKVKQEQTKKHHEQWVKVQRKFKKKYERARKIARERKQKLALVQIDLTKEELLLQDISQKYENLSLEIKSLNGKIRGHEKTVEILTKTVADLKEKIASSMEMIEDSMDCQDYFIACLLEEQRPLPSAKQQVDVDALIPFTFLTDVSHDRHRLVMFDGLGVKQGFIKVMYTRRNQFTGLPEHFHYEAHVSSFRMDVALTQGQKLRLARNQFKNCLKGGDIDFDLVSQYGRTKIESLLLEEHGIIYVVPNGHCFYSGTSYGKDRHYFHVQTLRDGAVEYYRSIGEVNSHFRPGLDMGGGLSFSCFDDFLSSISGNAYATDKEINAVSKKFNFAAVVLTLVEINGSPSISARIYNEGADNIYLYSHYEKHFDLLLPHDYKTRNQRQGVHQLLSSYKPRVGSTFSKKFNPLA